MKQSTNASIHLLLSVMAMIIVLLLVFAKYPEGHGIDKNARLLVGGAFIASCVFGISLALWPNWYKRSASVSNHRRMQVADGQTKRGLRGHHPDCEFFDSHRIALRRRTSCAGCFGIAVGASLAIAATVGYIVLARDGIGNAAKTLALAGLVVILLSFLETALPKGNALAHVVCNASLVIGLFLTTAGLFEATGIESVGLLGILFAFLWMDTRVRLSGWRHSLICSRCVQSCKMY